MQHRHQVHADMHRSLGSCTTLCSTASECLQELVDRIATLALGKDTSAVSCKGATATPSGSTSPHRVLMKRASSDYADSDLAPETPPPAQKRTRRSRYEAPASTELLDLNTDVLRLIPPLLGYRELCNLGSCSRTLHELTVWSFPWSTYLTSSAMHRC